MGEWQSHVAVDDVWSSLENIICYTLCPKGLGYDVEENYKDAVRLCI